MMIMKNHPGFTLIELLVTLAIVAIFAMLAVPSFHDIYYRSQSTAIINQVAGITRLARNIAVTEVSTTTLCPSLDGLTCTEEWEKGTILFTDENTNGQVDGNDKVIRFYRPFIKTGILSWKSLRNKIQFTERGFPRGTVGSFVYCPNNQDAHLGKSLILSFQGRLRTGQDSNGDGIIETGSGTNISCS